MVVSWLGGVIRAAIAAEIEAPVGRDFREQTQGVGAGPGLRVDQPEFDDLDVVLEDLHPLLRRCRFEQLADVLPRLQEGAGVADTLDRGLQRGDVGERPLELRLFRPAVSAIF